MLCATVYINFIGVFVAKYIPSDYKLSYITGKVTCRMRSRTRSGLTKVPNTDVSSSLAPEGQGSDEQLILLYYSVHL